MKKKRKKKNCRICGKAIPKEHLILCLKFSYPWDACCSQCYIKQGPKLRNEKIKKEEEEEEEEEKEEEEKKNKYNINNSEMMNYWEIPITDLHGEEEEEVKQILEDKEADVETEKRNYIRRYLSGQWKSQTQFASYTGFNLNYF